MSMEKAGKILALSLLVVLMVSFLANFVAAQDAGEKAKDTMKIIAGTFSDLFSRTGWTEGNLTPNIAKIFFFVMITIVIMLVLGAIFKKHQTLVIILSALIAFLATAYITPKEVYSLLISYTALGLTLTTLIPLALLAGFTYKAATATEGKVQLVMLQWFAWGLFAVYSIYRFVYDWFFSKEGSGILNGIILATAIIATIVFAFNKRILRMIVRRFIEEHTEATEEMLEEVWDIRRAEREAARRATGAGD